MENKKDISYLGKDFGQLRKNLIDFTKQYFPNTYSDFNESSPGMLFMEMAAYVGDVLAYYTDTNLKESLLEHASEKANIYDLARTLGYRPQNVTSAQTTLDIFQIVPAIGSGDDNKPDFNYALSIGDGMRVKQTQGSVEFRTVNSIDFSMSSSYDPTEITIYETDDTTNEPTYYLLKKSTPAVSGVVKTATYSFQSPKPYDKIVLPDSNVIEILSVTESDGDNWYEVPYLAQDTIFEQIANLQENDSELIAYKDSVSKLLKLKKTSKRFITHLRSDNRLELQFGAGISDNNDEEIIPNPTNVGNGLAGFRKSIDIDIDPSNFLYTRAYGQAPSNTTLTITYTTGNGLEDNVASGELTKLIEVPFQDDPNTTLSNSVVNFIKSSIAVNNPVPAVGGTAGDSLQEVKNKSLSAFSTQNRLVTKEDYIIRAYSMPGRFGSVAKAYIVPDDQITQDDVLERRIANPLAMNLYTLGYDANKKLVTLNRAIKENLKTYLDYYRILTDAVNIKDAFIINVGVNFEITTLSNFNSNEVLLRAVNNVKEFFNIDRWQINQPILNSELVNTIANTKGVQSVIDVNVYNLYETSTGYSGNFYDFDSATKNNIIYPSLDPSIFEVKYPNKDIRGRVVSY